jgi:hypothetical protein
MNPTPEQIEILTKTIAVLQEAIDGKELIHPDGDALSRPTLIRYLENISRVTVAKRKIKRKAWINVYSDSQGFADVFHARKELADLHCNPSRIACVPIEYEFDAPEGVTE